MDLHLFKKRIASNNKIRLFDNKAVCFRFIFDKHMICIFDKHMIVIQAICYIKLLLKCCYYFLVALIHVIYESCLCFK